MAQPETEKMAHGDTVNGTHDVALLLIEIKALREEMTEMRQAMRLLEYKPDPVRPVTPKTVPLPEPFPWWRRPISPRKGD